MPPLQGSFCWLNPKRRAHALRWVISPFQGFEALIGYATLSGFTLQEAVRFPLQKVSENPQDRR